MVKIQRAQTWLHGIGLALWLYPSTSLASFSMSYNGRTDLRLEREVGLVILEGARQWHSCITARHDHSLQLENFPDTNFTTEPDT